MLALAIGALISYSRLLCCGEWVTWRCRAPRYYRHLARDMHRGPAGVCYLVFLNAFLYFWWFAANLAILGKLCSVDGLAFHNTRVVLQAKREL